MQGDLGLPEAAPESVGLDPVRLSQIRPWIASYVDAGRLPGALVALARHRAVAHAEWMGWRDVERAEPFRADTIVRIYSMTKPITAAAALALVEEARLGLDDPVDRYVPEVRGLRVFAGDRPGGARSAGRMTVKHLLTHTSGLPYDGSGSELERMYRDAKLFEAPSLEAFVRRLVRLPLASAPGTEWRYGVSSDLLGRVLEIAAGEPFDKVVARRILEPLGMRDTAFSVPAEKMHRLAAAYRATPDRGIERADDTVTASLARRPGAPFGGHGLLSTARDCLRFAQALANRGALEGARILRAESVDRMLTDHLGPEFGAAPLAALAGSVQFPTDRVGYGLGGLIVRRARDDALDASPGTFAWGGNASTYFWIDRAERFVGLFLTQLEPSDAHPLREELRGLAYRSIRRA